MYSNSRGCVYTNHSRVLCPSDKCERAWWMRVVHLECQYKGFFRGISCRRHERYRGYHPRRENHPQARNLKRGWSSKQPSLGRDLRVACEWESGVCGILELTRFSLLCRSPFSSISDDITAAAIALARRRGIYFVAESSWSSTRGAFITYVRPTY